MKIQRGDDLHLRTRHDVLRIEESPSPNGQSTEKRKFPKSVEQTTKQHCLVQGAHGKRDTGQRPHLRRLPQSRKNESTAAGTEGRVRRLTADLRRLSVFVYQEYSLESGNGLPFSGRGGRFVRLCQEAHLPTGI